MSVKERQTPGRMSCASSQATRPEFGTTSAPDDDLGRKIVGGVFGGGVHRGFSLEKDDPFGFDP